MGYSGATSHRTRLLILPQWQGLRPSASHVLGVALCPRPGFVPPADAVTEPRLGAVLSGTFPGLLCEQKPAVPVLTV